MPARTKKKERLTAYAGASVLVALLLVARTSTAQGEPTQSPEGPLLPPHGLRSLDVQVDPTPFFLKGFAPELGVAVGKHRVFATVVAYDVPAFLAEDSRFTERRVLGALGYQYFFLGHVRGPFASASMSLVRSRFALEETGGTRSTTTAKGTLRLGWALAPFSAVPELFFAPWIGPVVSIAPEDFAINGREIQRRAVGVSGAIQVGWRFGL